jgi:hypothetical protein
MKQSSDDLTLSTRTTGTEKVEDLGWYILSRHSKQCVDRLGGEVGVSR